MMIKYFDQLNDLGAQLLQHFEGDENSTKTVNSQLQNCQDRWDNLVQRMEHCSKQVLLSANKYYRIVRCNNFNVMILLIWC